MSDPVFRQFRIRGAQVVSLQPLIVRQRAGADVRLRIDDEEARPLEAGQILFWIGSAPGPVEVDGSLPVVGDDLGPDLIELVFPGTAQARIEGKDLVIESTCSVQVVAGEGFVPFDRAQVEAASIVALESDFDDIPHQPKRQP